MLTIQRRHTRKCPDRNHSDAPNYLKCRGHCPLRICGTVNGNRVRKSLKTRDLGRAARRLAEMEQQETIGRPPKALCEAIDAFHAQHAGQSSETNRKYKRVLRYLSEYCAQRSLGSVDQINVETMDGYQLWRNKTGWTWIKEIEVLRQFFTFSIDREWTTKNPARALRRPRLIEANNIVPYTQEAIVCILAACDQIGRRSYERLRARARTLLMRFAGLRISDVETLSRDHIKGKLLEKRAVKNHRWLRVELPPEVLEALDRLPLPLGAAQDCRLYFSSGNASLRSVLKGAERAMSAVFKRSGVERAHCHRFRHTLASELLAKGVPIQVVADILGDTVTTIERHYAKWMPERQARQDEALRRVHGTNLAQTEEQVSKC
jgi:site-specific recombinase XerD